MTNRVRAVLTDRGLSGRDLADLTELTYHRVRRILAPASNPPLECVLRIAAALGTPVERLFELRDDAEHDGRRR